MYESYWGIARSPFRGPADLRLFHESTGRTEALARLFYLVEERRACGLLAGPSGGGKSLLLAVLATQVKRTQRQRALVDLTGLTGEEFLWELAASLHLAPAEGDSPFRLWRTVCDWLRSGSVSRAQTVLIFDHVDRAGRGCAELIERLLHLDSGPERWLTTILAAADGPLPRSCRRLLPFADLRIELPALDRLETAEYIRDLLGRAGARREIFEERGVEAVYLRADGAVRAINRLCDLSLLAAMAEQRDTVPAEVVERAANELLLSAGPAEPGEWVRPLAG